MVKENRYIYTKYDNPVLIMFDFSRGKPRVFSPFNVLKGMILFCASQFL